VACRDGSPNLRAVGPAIRIRDRLRAREREEEDEWTERSSSIVTFPPKCKSRVRAPRGVTLKWSTVVAGGRLIGSWSVRETSRILVDRSGDLARSLSEQFRDWIGQVDANRRRDRPRSSNPREDNYPRREVEPHQLISERVIFRDVLPRRSQWK
jgi:hypothetical protein